MNLILKILPCCLLWGIVLSDEEEDKKYKSRGMFSLYDLVNLAADLDTTFLNISKEGGDEDESETNNNKSIRGLSFKDVVTGNWNKDEHEIRSLEKTVKNMWRELNETSEEKATCLISLRGELKKTETLTQHLTKVLTKVKVTTKEYESLQSNHDELKNKYKSMESKARSYEKKYSSLDGKYMDLKLTNEELEKKMTTLTARIESFETKQLEFDEETRSLKNKNTFMTSRFDELERENEKYKMDNARLEKKYSDFVNKYSSLKSKYDYEKRKKCEY